MVDPRAAPPAAAVATFPRRPASAIPDSVLETIGEFIGRELDKLEAKLTGKLAEIEAKQLKLGGIWKTGVRYEEGMLVTFGGGLWLSRCATEARPGAESLAWRLAVKRGAVG